MFYEKSKDYPDAEYIVPAPYESYYPTAPPCFSQTPDTYGRRPMFGRERSINRQIRNSEQIEEARARITAQALNNTAELVDYQQQLMQRNPACSDYFEALVEEYVSSAGETIQSLGRPKNFNNPFNPNNKNYRR